MQRHNCKQYRQFVASFSILSETAEQAKAFQELATMEQGHKTRLEELYTNMAFPEVW